MGLDDDLKFYKNKEFVFKQIGITLSILNLIVGLTTLIAYKFEERLGRTLTLLFIVVGIISTYFLMGTVTHWSIFIVIGFFYFTRGIATPVLKDYINRLISSDIRATVLSVKNLMGRLIFSLIGKTLVW